MMVRYSGDMSAEEKVFVLVAGLSGPQRRSLLRHPAWTARCDCREFGFPYGAVLRLLTDDIIHERELCQPRREWIPEP